MATGSVSVADGATPSYYLVNTYTGAASRLAVALVDSGDQRAIASPTLLAQIGAQQVFTRSVVGVDGTPTTAGVYEVDWAIPGVGYVAALVPGREPIYTIGMDVSALGVQGLIGRNLLQTGSFVYAGAAGTYTLTLGVALPPLARPAAARVLPWVGLAGLGVAAFAAFAA